MDSDMIMFYKLIEHESYVIHLAFINIMILYHQPMWYGISFQSEQRRIQHSAIYLQ